MAMCGSAGIPIKILENNIKGCSEWQLLSKCLVPHESYHFHCIIAKLLEHSFTIPNDLSKLIQ